MMYTLYALICGIYNMMCTVCMLLCGNFHMMTETDTTVLNPISTIDGGLIHLNFVTVL